MKNRSVIHRLRHCFYWIPVGIFGLFWLFVDKGNNLQNHESLVMEVLMLVLIAAVYELYYLFETANQTHKSEVIDRDED